MLLGDLVGLPGAQISTLLPASLSQCVCAVLPLLFLSYCAVNEVFVSDLGNGDNNRLWRQSSPDVDWEDNSFLFLSVCYLLLCSSSGEYHLEHSTKASAWPGLTEVSMGAFEVRCCLKMCMQASPSVCLCLCIHQPARLRSGSLLQPVLEKSKTVFG